MGENSKIQWCDHTANFWEGCQKVAAGCKNCYAEAFERRVGNDIWGNRPRKWTKTGPALIRKLQKKAAAAGRIDKVFVNDLSDFFEDHQGVVVNKDDMQLCVCHGCGKFVLYTESCDCDSPKRDRCPRKLSVADLRAEASNLFDECPNLIFQLLTKRPENIRKMLDGKFRKNVWLGVSIANQEDADRNIPLLLQCRDLAPVLFVSYEPAIGHVDFGDWLEFIDWIIVGGESGPNARPFNIQWARFTAQQCDSVGVRCFIKQMGSNPFEYRNDCEDGEYAYPVSLKAKKGDDPAEWPEDLRVRQFPAGVGRV